MFFPFEDFGKMLETQFFMTFWSFLFGCGFLSFSQCSFYWTPPLHRAVPVIPRQEKMATDLLEENLAAKKVKSQVEEAPEAKQRGSRALDLCVFLFWWGGGLRRADRFLSQKRRGLWFF